MRHEQALESLVSALSEVLEAPVESLPVSAMGPYEPDAELSASGLTFVVECKTAASADVVGSGLAALRRVSQARPDVVPLLLVPFMGDVGKRLCRERGISWLDLSGNADIAAPGLRIRIEGRPNAHARPGRPRDLFAPTYSRLARALLLHPRREFTAGELSDLTGMHRGTLSTLLPRYEDAGFIRPGAREERSARWIARDPDLLLDAWQASYDFWRHDVRQGHIPARSGMELLRHISDRLERDELPCAATGLGAAWLLEPFATFRLVTVYVPPSLPAVVLEDLGFADEPRGANTWLVHANDEGVFMGSAVTQGIRHVSPVQAYLDLKAQPERSEEAAEELRRRQMPWGAE